MIASGRRGERGQVAGIEVLPFGLLVFVTGTLLLANIWGVIDAKLATDSAAREAARWVVESAGRAASEDALVAGATQIAEQTLAANGRAGPATVELKAAEGVARCARVQVSVSIDVPAIRVPFVGGFGRDFDITATHSELVDPTRSGVDGTAWCIQ